MFAVAESSRSGGIAAAVIAMDQELNVPDSSIQFVR